MSRTTSRTLSLVSFCLLILVAAPNARAGSEFNAPGNILITDQFNNRVIEIDPGGNIVWQFGHGPGDTSESASAT